MDFAPHVTCLRNDPTVVAAFLVGDGMTSLAYKLIPVCLGLLVYWRRNDLERSWRLLGMLTLFAAFILCCGLGHDFRIWNLWNADYRLEAAWCLVTGIVSILTAVLLVWYLPLLRTKALPQQFEVRTRRLRALVERVDELAMGGDISAAVATELRAARQDLEGLP